MVQAKEIHGEGPHEPGPPQDTPAGALAGLLTAAQLGITSRAARSAHEAPDGARPHPEVSATPDSLPELEKRMVLDALAKTKGNRSRAAKLLGLTRFQLYTRLKRYGLDT